MAEKTVLIIDDDQTLVEALKEGLESLGFKVVTAYDGLQGVLQAHQGRPSVIMLDFNMPAGGGAGVYDRLRASTDTAQTPIIFLTGATVEEVKDKIRSTPNTYFLKKPISVAQLRKVLEKILGSVNGAAPANAASDAPLPAVPHPESSEGALPPPPAPKPEAKKEEAPESKEDPLRRDPTGPFKGMGTPASQPVKPPEPVPEAKPAVEAPAPSAQAPAPAQASSGPAEKSSGLEGQIHELALRVASPSTDRLGIMYYAEYLKVFEQGREEYLRAIGLRLRDLEMQRRIFLPVVESRCEYVMPCRYDDQLKVRTWISWLGPASICFQHEIFDIEDGAERSAARGFTRHAILNEMWKPTRTPKDLRELFARYLVRP